jgi:predicted nucleotidyltransferase
MYSGFYDGADAGNREDFQMVSISPEIEDNIQRFIALIQKEICVLKVFLYGSYAKGVAGKWSDIDLAVISPDFSEGLFEERIRLMKLALRVDDRIEPSPFRPEDFDETNPLVNQINESGIERDSYDRGSQ